MLGRMKTKFLRHVVSGFIATLRRSTDGPRRTPKRSGIRDQECAVAGKLHAFTFVVTNVSKAAVSINDCTPPVAAPSQLDHALLLQPGSNVINVAMDLRGKSGLITKTVTVESTARGKNSARARQHSNRGKTVRN
jgi:hypothetical protein